MWSNGYPQKFPKDQKVTAELESGNLKLKKSVPDILKWFSQTSENPVIRQAASSVIMLMNQYEQERKAKETEQEQPSLFDLLDEEDWK